MKHLVGKVQTKKVPFMGDEVEIRKLPVHDIMELQEEIKKSQKKNDHMGLLFHVLKVSVIGADELTKEEFETFPPSDLNELAEAVLEYCGLSDKSAAGN
jgi:hypothetical protein